MTFLSNCLNHCKSILYDADSSLYYFILRGQQRNVKLKLTTTYSLFQLAEQRPLYFELREIKTKFMIFINSSLTLKNSRQRCQFHNVNITFENETVLQACNIN
jgi:hypothetical protein